MGSFENTIFTVRTVMFTVWTTFGKNGYFSISTSGHTASKSMSTQTDIELFGE